MTSLSYSDIPFLFYFLPPVITGYFLLSAFQGSTAKNVFLLLASLVFLGWLEPLFLPLIVLLTLINYALGRGIRRAWWEGRDAKHFLWAGYIINGGLFLLFQLAAMLVSHGVSLMGLEQSLFKSLLLPVGIGLFVLRSISYISDVYRRRIEAERNYIHLSLYLCFFPQIVVGPLTSYRDFKPQLQRRQDGDLFAQGVCRFVIGLGKKILLANNLAVITDTVFTLSSTSHTVTQVPVALAWLGIGAFLLQIYYDLSGYTDIAIGLSNVFGFTAPENFNYPYMANSVNDYWNRWLISIKDWFNRYVARQLDNRRSSNNDQRIANLFIAFLALGLWHKASIGMALWALLQILFIAFEQVITYDQRSIPRPVKHLYVLFTLVLSAALIRYTNAYHTLLFLRNLFGLSESGFSSPLALTLLKENWAVLIPAVVFAFPLAPKLKKRIDESGRGLRAVSTVIYPLLLSGVVLLIMLYVARGLYVPAAYLSL